MCFRLDVSVLLLLLICTQTTVSFNLNYTDLPDLYRLLIPLDVFNSVRMSDSDSQITQKIYYDFDTPIPLNNITEALNPVAPIFTDKILGFMEKIGFQFDILKVKHPREEASLDELEKHLCSFLATEAVDVFAFTPVLDIQTFREASSKYGPLMHVRMEEMNEQISKLLPYVKRAIDLLTAQFKKILETLEDDMLELQLEVITYLKNTTIEVDFDKVDAVVRGHVHELVPEALEPIRQTLPYAMINAMSEIRYKEMEDVWRIHKALQKGSKEESDELIGKFHSFDVDFLGWMTRKMLNNSLDALIAHKKFALVRDLTNFGTNFTIHVDEALLQTNFMERMDDMHSRLFRILGKQLNLHLLEAIGSVNRREHRYVRRLVAHYLNGEQLLTKTDEIKEQAPYLTGKVLFGAQKVNYAVRRYCYSHPKVCPDLNVTAEFVKNYYVRGMLRIFDLLPENEISSIKKTQTQFKLDKYRTVILSLIEHCPTLFKAIETVHSKLESKLGAMEHLGTQEFTRQLEADTLRILLLISISQDAHVEDYRAYAQLWKWGFTSLGQRARAEVAASLPEFVKALTT